MDELGVDLLLLAARADGTLPILPKLRFGIAGSEQVSAAVDAATQAAVHAATDAGHGGHGGATGGHH